MFENDTNMNAKELRSPTEKREQICVVSCNLLKLLCEIESMVNRIDNTLFCRPDDKEGCNPTPACLAENMEMAMDRARVIEKTLNRIIDRL